MQKRWLQEYQPGVPAEIDPGRYQSVVHMLNESFAKYREKTAFECLGASLRYDQLDKYTRHLAAYLQARDLEKGDRVAIMLPNILQYPIAAFAILRAGYTVVNVNPLYTPRELEHQLIDSGAKAIIILEDFAVVLEQVISRTKVRHVIVASMGEMLGALPGATEDLVVRNDKKMVPPFSLPDSITFKRTLTEGANLTFRPVELEPDDLAFLQYTGGTTGVSKGAMLLHRNVVANLMQVQAWTAEALSDSEKYVVTPLPLYHIYPLSNCLLYASIGGKNLLIPNPRDIPALIQELKHHRIDAIIGVNTLFNALLATPEFHTLDFSGLKMVMGAGAAVQQAVAEKWQSITGAALSEAYGLTETSPGVSVTPLHKPAWSGSVGVPLPSTMVSLRDENGKEVDVGERGEVCIAGPQVMPGYWQRPEENATAFTEDGYFKTGDVATMDANGYIRIVDRIKDMILVSGFNVYPTEIEAAAALHPGVLEVACVGVPDDRSGEAVKVFIVKRDPGLTEEDVRNHCRQNLTGYKVPRHIEFRDVLPKSPVGKILRKELRT